MSDKTAAPPNKMDCDKTANHSDKTATLSNKMATLSSIWESYAQLIRWRHDRLTEQKLQVSFFFYLILT